MSRAQIFLSSLLSFVSSSCTTVLPNYEVPEYLHTSGIVPDEVFCRELSGHLAHVTSLDQWMKSSALPDPAALDGLLAKISLVPEFSWQSIDLKIRSPLPRFSAFPTLEDLQEPGNFLAWKSHLVQVLLQVRKSQIAQFVDNLSEQFPINANFRLFLTRRFSDLGLVEAKRRTLTALSKALPQTASVQDLVRAVTTVVDNANYAQANEICTHAISRVSAMAQATLLSFVSSKDDRWGCELPTILPKVTALDIALALDASLNGLFEEAPLAEAVLGTYRYMSRDINDTMSELEKLLTGHSHLETATVNKIVDECNRGQPCRCWRGLLRLEGQLETLTGASWTGKATGRQAAAGVTLLREAVKGFFGGGQNYEGFCEALVCRGEAACERVAHKAQEGVEATAKRMLDIFTAVRGDQGCVKVVNKADAMLEIGNFDESENAKKYFRQVDAELRRIQNSTCDLHATVNGVFAEILQVEFSYENIPNLIVQSSETAYCPLSKGVSWGSLPTTFGVRFAKKIGNFVVCDSVKHSMLMAVDSVIENTSERKGDAAVKTTTAMHLLRKWLMSNKAEIFSNARVSAGATLFMNAAVAGSSSALISRVNQTGTNLLKLFELYVSDQGSFLTSWLPFRR